MSPKEYHNLFFFPTTFNTGTTTIFVHLGSAMHDFFGCACSRLTYTESQPQIPCIFYIQMHDFFGWDSLRGLNPMTPTGTTAIFVHLGSTMHDFFGSASSRLTYTESQPQIPCIHYMQMHGFFGWDSLRGLNPMIPTGTTAIFVHLGSAMHVFFVCACLERWLRFTRLQLLHESA